MNEIKRKKRIFIGSSSETCELANKIKIGLESVCDCFVWNEDFFKPGGYVYVDLIKKAIGFDYAILIGGADDKVIRLSQNTEKLSPRDNIYLEYGMYSGILSPGRVLFLIHEDCVVASDLAGMTLKTYKNQEDTLDICKKWVVDTMNGKVLNSDTAKSIELLPTVGIAVGYFHNFLSPVLDLISKTRKFTFEGKEYDVREKKLIVDVPAYLESDDCAVDEYKNVLIDQKGLKDAFLGRYRVLIDPDGLDSGVLTLYDMPTTLLSVFKTVDFIFGVTSGLGPEDAQHAKYRALDNFIDILAELLEGKPRLSAHLEFSRFTF